MSWFNSTRGICHMISSFVNLPAKISITQAIGLGGSPSFFFQASRDRERLRPSFCAHSLGFLQKGSLLPGDHRRSLRPVNRSNRAAPREISVCPSKGRSISRDRGHG